VTPAEFKPMRYAAVALAVALAVLLPWLAPNQFYVHLATIGCINLMLVLGLAIIARAGQLSMGHGGFALIGGYVSALLSMNGWPGVLSLFVAALVAAVVAAGLGWIILRLRGVYFVLVAFAFSQILVLLALDMSTITGGANGLVGIPPISIFGHVLHQAAILSPGACLCAGHAIVHLGALSVAVGCDDGSHRRESSFDGVEWRRYAPGAGDCLHDRIRHRRLRGRVIDALSAVHLA
jgi:branched-chain amino acid transport system permease protein